MVSPCGHKVAYTNGSDKNFNLFVVDRESGEVTQLTDYSDQSVRTIVWVPDSKGLVFCADRDGDEYYQLFALDLASKECKQLTDRPSTPHQMLPGAVSPDGQMVAFSANITDESKSQAWVYRLSDGVEIELTTETGFVVPTAWSADSSTVFGTNVTSNTTMRPFSVEVDSQELTWLGPGDAICGIAGQRADGKVIGWSGLEREFNGLAVFHGGELDSWMFTPEWDVDFAVLNGNESVVVVGVNEDGYTKLRAFEADSGADVELPELPAGVVPACSISHDGNVVAVLHSGPQSPPNVLVLDRTVGTWEKVTTNVPSSAAIGDLVASELVSTTSHDGMRLPAFVYRPEGDGPFPVVFSIHGGPQAQEVADYRPFYQALVARGFAVVAPNIRGSKGYGVTCMRMIEANWGADDLRDVATLRAFIAGQDWADESRMGVYGGSYGGFMVLSCMSRQPELWNVGVDIVGPSDLIAMCDNVPPTWRPMMASWVGDPETDAERMRNVSPINHADKIRSPLFVIQGAKDPRVVQEHSDLMVEKARAAGADVRYDIYPDEGHGFTRRENENKAMQDSLDFLTKHLS